jgi:DNA processing protein
MSTSSSNNLTDQKYWVALSQFAKIGPVRFKKIYSHFSTMKEAWLASPGELRETGLEEEIAAEIIAKRESIDPDEEWEKLEAEKIKVTTILDDDYPKMLKEIYKPPAILYCKGKLEAINEFALAVVGTRKITPYGAQVTCEIVRDLAKSGLTIVSGLALGIDALAHKTTVENNGITIAVLGSGLSSRHLYPASNHYLADQIIAHGGAVISEFPLTMLPLKHNFPIRNRIVAGLSLGTLVIEAGVESGALITARYALEQNREVFAVPGNIFSPNAFGPNNLIKMGAKMVTSANDILETLNLSQAASFIETQKIIPESKEEEIILKFLTKEPIHVDKLVNLSGLGTATANSTLLMMEIKGKVKNLGGANYVLAR